MSVSRVVSLVAAACLSSMMKAPMQSHAGGGPLQTAPSSLAGLMDGELNRDMKALHEGAQPSQPAPYFISYDVHDVASFTILAEQGAILDAAADHKRTADIEVRVGDPKLDNTHGTHRASSIHTVTLPLSDDPIALRRALWWGTNVEYGNALRTYLNVQSEAAVHAKEEDGSPDFSREKPVRQEQPLLPAPAINQDQWEARVRELSAVFRAHPRISNSVVEMTASVQDNTFVSSENSEIAFPHAQARIVVAAGARTDDGAQVSLVRTFEGRDAEGLPSQGELLKQVKELAKQLDELRTAPPAEPFDGPALLSGRAAAVFFHEVLGHRLEGQRQRGNNEGETFTKDIGKPILPSFLSVADDPTMRKFGDTNLSGYYAFDDEGQPAQRVDLIQNGVLQQFLMSRMPIANFSSSNGHGRAQDGKMPTGRQGNLIVTSSKTVSDAQLRKMFVEEIKKQGKPYGLYFADISSGFTLTQRATPQAFQVIPLVVYRVYADGRPDQLVRGVNIVGTPQAALTRIVATGDKPAVFNGECGAESGTVPVSAVAPAMLFSEMETQKAAQGGLRPPVMPPPDADGSSREAQ